MAATVGGSAGGLRRSTRPPAPPARYDRRAGGAATGSGKSGSRGSGRVVSACDEIDEPPDDREGHVLLKLPEHLADQLRERLRAEADPEVAVVFSGTRTSRWRCSGCRLQPELMSPSAPAGPHFACRAQTTGTRRCASAIPPCRACCTTCRA